MEKNSVPIQLYLFDLVRKNLSPNESLVDVLADLLKITNDSAYRRLRGSTILDIEELFLICEHFHIPIDSLYNSQDNYVNFKYSPMPSHVSSLPLYIKSILNDIEQIVKAEQKHIVFTSEDLPIFHYFNYPNLTAFKLYYWNRCILNAPGFENKKFDMALFDEEILQNAAKIYNIYTQIPSTEIWTEDTVESVVKQIEFCWESGMIANKEDAFEIISQLEEMLKNLENQAVHSSKTEIGDTNFTLYWSEVMIGNNCIQVSMNDLQYIYFSFNTFNSMKTNNVAFCKETDSWIKNLIRKSIQISGVSEKHRYKFFSSINKSVNALKNKIQ